jgi:hypothetical protein
MTCCTAGIYSLCCRVAGPGGLGWGTTAYLQQADMELTLRKPVSMTRCISATLHLMTLQNRL